MKSFVFANPKGGVGRTTVAGNTAAAIAAQGSNVAMVTTAEADWASLENLTVLDSSIDGLREAVNEGQSAAGSGIFVLDLPACDQAASWWTGDADVVIVTDAEASSLFSAMESIRLWNSTGHAPVGFLLNHLSDGSVADEVAAKFRRAVAQFTSVHLPYFGCVPSTKESSTLVNRGRFCSGKPNQVYVTLANRMMAERSASEPSPVLDALKSRRESLRAA